MITWNKDWIQEHESVWGIFEKFKFANQINGKDLFCYFTDNKNATYTSTSVRNKSFDHLLTIAKSKLSEILEININDFRIELKGLLKTEHLELPILNENIRFCKQCINTGYHSIFHQFLFLSNCPFHPEIQLTDKCPNCNKDFRNNNLGFKESGYCCKSCDFSMINNMDLFTARKYWLLNKKIKSNYISSLINDIVSNNINARFIYLAKFTTRMPIKREIYLSINQRFLYLLGQKNLLPIAREKNKHNFTMVYKTTEDSYKIGYTHRELLRSYQETQNLKKSSILQINKFKSPEDLKKLNYILNYEISKRTKPIFRSVDRYIQKKLHLIIKKSEDKNNKISEKYREGYNIWKDLFYRNSIGRPYYDRLSYNFLKESYLDNYGFINSHVNFTEINSGIFEEIISKYKKEGYSFSFIANVYCKLLFNFYYFKFQQCILELLLPDKPNFYSYNLPPFIQISRKREVSFINCFEMFNLEFTMINNPSIQW